MSTTRHIDQLHVLTTLIHQDSIRIVNYRFDQLCFDHLTLIHQLDHTKPNTGNVLYTSIAQSARRVPRGHRHLQYTNRSTLGSLPSLDAPQHWATPVRSMSPLSPSPDILRTTPATTTNLSTAGRLPAPNGNWISLCPTPSRPSTAVLDPPTSTEQDPTTRDQKWKVSPRSPPRVKMEPRQPPRKPHPGP